MHFCCKSKFFEGQNYFGGMKCSKVEGEWSPFWESYNFCGEINHFYGAIFTLCWPLNTLLNPPKNLGSGPTPPLLLVNTGLHGFGVWVKEFCKLGNNNRCCYVGQNVTSDNVSQSHISSRH